MGSKGAVAPVLKWVGGKRQLLPEIQKYIPENIHTYYEPFVGGGAVLFSLQPKRAIVNDINTELINVYIVITEHVEDLIQELSKTRKYSNTEKNFYRIRELDRDSKKIKKLSAVERAARILYLNRTCYNGLYRVNSAGEFNTPFGNYKNPNIINEMTLRAVSSYLEEAEITFLNGDFEETLRQAQENDFVYLDPPYVPVSRTSNFTGYSEVGFGENEQERLKQLCDDLQARGVRFLLSNSDCKYIQELYADYQIIPITAKRNINANPKGRSAVGEVLIRNYE